MNGFEATRHIREVEAAKEWGVDADSFSDLGRHR